MYWSLVLRFPLTFELGHTDNRDSVSNAVSIKDDCVQLKFSYLIRCRNTLYGFVFLPEKVLAESEANAACRSGAMYTSSPIHIWDPRQTFLS